MKIMKRLICILLSAALVLSFASCAAGNRNTSADEAEAEEVDFRTIYHDFMTDLYNEKFKDADEYNYATFGMFCIDSDSVPELVVSEYISHGMGADIYTIVDGEVKSVGTYGTFGSCQFGKGNGIIRSYSAYFGEMEYDYYKLENGTATFVFGGYDYEQYDFEQYDDENNPHKYCIYETDPRDGDTDNVYFMTDKSTFEAGRQKYEAMITDDTYESGYMLDVTPENIDYYKEYYGRTAFDLKAYENAKDYKLGVFGYGEEDGASLKYYFCDLNNDGYEDIIYYYEGHDPVVSIYRNGVFFDNTIESEAKAGSLFPSGTNSGLFFDAVNGVLIYRYGGHTEGTALYNGAQAYEIDGTKLSSLWVIYADEDKFSDEEDSGKAEEECLADFENTYARKTSGYTLTDFFDVCTVSEQ